MTRVAPRRRLLPRDLRRRLLDEHNGQLARMPRKTRDARHPRKRAPPRGAGGTRRRARATPRRRRGVGARANREYGAPDGGHGGHT